VCKTETWTKPKADISRILAAGMQFLINIEGKAKIE
jgi:hypothetical protein